VCAYSVKSRITTKKTNNLYVRRVIIFLCHIRSNTVGLVLLLRSLREIDVFSAKFDSLVLTMHKTLPTDWLMFKIFCSHLL